MDNTILKLVNVSKKIGKKTIIDDLSLEIEKGQVYGFLGPNGAGKTTTIKMITGLISIDKGSISIDGHDVVKDFEKAIKHVGAIVENPNLYEYMSGLDNLKLFARLHKVSKERIDEVVKQVGLEERIKDKVKKYSLGMKQRLALAVTLLHLPKIVILDEPTNGLDPKGVKELRETLKSLAHDKGITVFVSSHMLSEVELMCDKVAIIDKGKLIKIESLTKSIEEEEIPSYIVEVDNANRVQEILKDKYEITIEDNTVIVKNERSTKNLLLDLISCEVEIFNFNKKQNSLEDEFLKVTGGEK